VVIVSNVDDSTRFNDPAESINWFDAGTARFSVPAGRYHAIALFYRRRKHRLTGAGSATAQGPRRSRPGGVTAPG